MPPRELPRPPSCSLPRSTEPSSTTSAAPAVRAGLAPPAHLVGLLLVPGEGHRSVRRRPDQRQGVGHECVPRRPFPRLPLRARRRRLTATLRPPRPPQPSGSRRGPTTRARSSSSTGTDRARARSASIEGLRTGGVVEQTADGRDLPCAPSRYQITNPCANVNGLLKGSCVPLAFLPVSAPLGRC